MEKGGTKNKDRLKNADPEKKEPKNWTEKYFKQ